KVGGMITDAKKIRTRSGSTMMFATLDDLDGSVEIVVFEKALAAAEGVLALDEIVMVRGRVDHKDANKVCVIVQEVSKFEPTEAEIDKAKAVVAQTAELNKPQRLRLRVDAGRLEATVIADLRDLFERYPGDDEFVLEMDTRAGLRCLRFGGDYRISARNAAFTGELRRLLGPALARPVPAAPEPVAELEAAVA
ncbi:MAG: polymerase subunit alpha, partial [Solirubrobacteraceae bacterium]|nr:polymerase subunit alpha [Solirubrobacteraceae bacterium]